MLKFLDVNAHLPPTQAKILLELACGKTGSHSVMLVSLIEDGHPSLSWFMGLRSVRNPWYASILRPLLRGLDVEGGREVVICRGEGDGGGDLQLLLKGRRRGASQIFTTGEHQPSSPHDCYFVGTCFLEFLVFLPFCGLLVHEYEGEPWRSGKAAAL
ncbi:uncharacterized protein LOC119296198 isoform X3 [Triticum dicoccoides]|uniref:uncharacterized protein LOC119296198 isoform X3 n=1 Tax=Triticum dicoccoides TaxID=85692 RepID=UPI00188F47AD|nr:uncharacterized protein LOC119296198 isoform X3 [Triticum dicoccoides]